MLPSLEPVPAISFFWLGQADRFPEQRKQNRRSKSPEPAKRPPRILVIDDEASIADSLIEILTEHGCEAIAAYEGQAAIEFARQWCPDLVLSDVFMPRLNGIETALAIRKECPEARVVLFSGQAGTADILKQARDAGNDFELLRKPLHPEELLKRLFGPQPS